jgi:type IV secretory pathway VirB10-like protein
MRDRSDRYEVKTAPSSLTGVKRLGGYLVEAGLLSTAQVDVALNDQQATGMRFGEVLAARGWVKQQTIEYLMKKVVLPERQSLKQRSAQPDQAKRNSTVAAAPPPPPPSRPAAPSYARTHAQEQTELLTRQEMPISKPWPSVDSNKEDVNWVG